MSLPDNNNAVGGVFNQVKNVLKKNRKGKADAFNRKMDWHNANVFANHEANRQGALESHKSGLRKDEHTHVTNEGLRVFDTTGQALKSNKSAGGSNEFYQDSPNAKYKTDLAKEAMKRGQNPFGGGDNGGGAPAQTPTGAPASRTTSNVAGAIAPAAPKAIGAGSSFISSSNGETSAPSGW